MEPITREEYYLAKIAGTYEGNTPEPVTIEEYYLATMAGDYSGNTPQPVTRLQYYMAKVAGVWGGSIPAPVTRLEYYWAAIANGEGTVFPPVTREEHFLVLVADAYSVVLTVVTGNPALLENSKGNRGLESLTLYGKSTQMNTTGAQLFPFEVGKKGINFEVFEDGIVISCKKGTDIYAVGRPNATLESSYDDFPLLAPGEYYIYSDSKYVELLVTTFVNGEYLILGVSTIGAAVKIKVIAGYKFRILLRCREDVETKVKAMISKTQPTASNYEPYTGGKPSPSPEYPQEIESTGQSGEIGVTVTGTNLLPFEVGQKGKGFEVFADGVQVDVDRETDIYAVGRNNGNVESGYDEFALMTAGKYYIYSGTQDVYLYVVVWRKGKNVVLGYSVGTDAEQIEIMDGDKFRIFLRTTAAFKGKVKAMITRTPMNATSYEPYKPAQTLIIPTPNGLPGIPVSSGGNYTDSDGQQWVCDEVDFKKGVYVQRVATETPKAKWKNFEETADVPNRYRISGALVNIYRDGSTKCLISHGIYANWGIAPGWALNSTTFYYHPKEDVTKEEAKEQILGFINSANPLTFLGQLETPIEKPLTTEQLATYKALRTYSPTTTVANDAEAGMSVGYAKMK
nr:MAG: hypothetical protein [Bacteriophage sp.]